MMKPSDDSKQKTNSGLSAVETLSTKQSLRAWLKLLKTTKHVEAVVRQKLRQEFETTLPRFDVMAALYRFEDGLRMSELSASLRVSNGNVTGIIERLVSDGAVLRVPVEDDKRAMLVILTKKGREEFEKLANAHERWISDVFSNLTSAQSTELIKIIDTIEHALALQDDD
jgi:DNA-binding MarR family transcriptional regulator